jgi:hypothetical protein
MPSLVEHSSLEALGSGRYQRNVEEGPFWGAGAAHGGYLMALLLHAMTLELGQDARRPRVFSGQFLGRTRPGPAMIEVEALRLGRSVSSLRAQLRVGENVSAAASVIFAIDRQGPAFNDEALPSVPGPHEPDTGLLGFDVAPVHERFEFHRRFGHDGAGLPCEDGGWVVPLEKEAWDHRLALLVSDVWVPPIIRHPQRMCATPSLHHVVHFGADVGGDAESALLVRHTLSSGGAGLTDEDISMWADDGRLLLRARQLRQVAPLSRMGQLG